MQNSIPHGVFMQKSTKLLLYQLYTTPLALQKSTSTITTTKHNTVLWICTIYYYIASTILLFCYIHCTVGDLADILLFFKGFFNQLVIRVIIFSNLLFFVILNTGIREVLQNWLKFCGKLWAIVTQVTWPWVIVSHLYLEAESTQKWLQSATNKMVKVIYNLI